VPPIGDEVSANLPNQYHLLLQLSAGIQFRTNLVIEIEEFLERLAFGRHDEPNDMHEKIGHWVAAEHYCQDTAHGVDFGFIGALLELGFEILLTRLVCRVVQMNQAVGTFEETSHGCKSSGVKGTRSGRCYMKGRSS
jgi:hypothetical protein